jgi:hypothetical protein
MTLNNLHKYSNAIQDAGGVAMCFGAVCGMISVNNDLPALTALAIVFFLAGLIACSCLRRDGMR